MAAAAASASALVLLVSPVYDSEQTLTQENGAEAAWGIFVPLLLALVPLAVPAGSRRVVGYAAGGVLLATSFISSAGLFLLVPAMLLLLAAHAAPSPEGP